MENRRRGGRESVTGVLKVFRTGRRKTDMAVSISAGLRGWYAGKLRFVNQEG